MKAILQTTLVTSVILLSGCFSATMPFGSTVVGHKIKPEDLEWIHLHETPRQEIVANWGRPHFEFADVRVFGYEWTIEQNGSWEITLPNLESIASAMVLAGTAAAESSRQPPNGFTPGFQPAMRIVPLDGGRTVRQGTLGGVTRWCLLFACDDSGRISRYEIIQTDPERSHEQNAKEWLSRAAPSHPK